MVKKFLGSHRLKVSKGDLMARGMADSINFTVLNGGFYFGANSTHEFFLLTHCS